MGTLARLTDNVHPHTSLEQQLVRNIQTIVLFRRFFHRWGGNLRFLGFRRPPGRCFHCGLGLFLNRCRRVEWNERDISLGIQTHQLFDTLLGPFEELVTLAQQTDAFLETAQGLIQCDGSALEIRNDFL